MRSPSEEPFKLRSISDEGFTDNALFISSVQGFCLKCFLTISTQMAGGERKKKKQKQTHGERREWGSGRQSQTCGLFVRTGSAVAPRGIKQRSRRCCYR